MYLLIVMKGISHKLPYLPASSVRSSMPTFILNPNGVPLNNYPTSSKVREASTLFSKRLMQNSRFAKEKIKFKIYLKETN